MFIHKVTPGFILTLTGKRTEPQQVPDPRFWCRIKHHVHHPESVNHFHSHPAEDAQECVVQQTADEAAHTLGRHVGHGTGEDEEHQEEEQSHNQTTVHQTRLVLRFPKIQKESSVYSALTALII